MIGINNYLYVFKQNRINLNILYYDEELKEKDENKDISAFFEMNEIEPFMIVIILNYLKKYAKKLEGI